jgi:hypothetical protein
VDWRFKLLIGVEELAVIWSLWLRRNDKVFNDKKCFSYAGHISVQFFAPFMVTSAPYGGSGPLYDGTWLENTVNFFIFEHG